MQFNRRVDTPAYDVERAGFLDLEESEISIEGPILPEQIIGYWKIDETTGRPGNFIPNEDFVPLPDRPLPEIPDIEKSADNTLPSGEMNSSTSTSDTNPAMIGCENNVCSPELDCSRPSCKSLEE